MLRFKKKKKGCLVIQFASLHQKRIRVFQQQPARGKSISGTLSLSETKNRAAFLHATYLLIIFSEVKIFSPNRSTVLTSWASLSKALCSQNNPHHSPCPSANIWGWHFCVWFFTFLMMMLQFYFKIVCTIDITLLQINKYFQLSADQCWWLFSQPMNNYWHQNPRLWVIMYQNLNK